MIKPAFLKKQVDRSKRDYRTAPFLRRLIFSVVEHEARRRYATKYCMRCFRCSAAIVMLLKHLGIQSGMVAGAFCIAEVCGDIRDLRWGGFWDRDHHVWAMSEFGEVIDLSIGQLHRHPRATRDGAIPTPPIWWADAGVMPPIFRYLPDTVVHALADSAEIVDLEEFKSAVTSEFDHVLERSEIADIAFGPILDGMGTLQAMTDAGEPWATNVFVVQRYDLPLPPWVAEREAELLEHHRLNRHAPSRLAGCGMFLGTGQT